MKRLSALVMTIALLLTCGLVQDVRSQKAVAVSKNEPLKVNLPIKKDSVKFAIIGDTGSGTDKQQQIGDMMVRYKETFPFEFVLMMGDNLYGGDSAKDYQKKFESVYKPLLDAKLKFYATLGNHDEANQRLYEHFNMIGDE